MQLTQSQTSVVQSDSILTVAIAGPGSGKTATSVERIRHLVGLGSDPSRIVIITFTNAAANEIRSRLGDVAVSYCGTLHGYMLRLLMQHGDKIGFPKDVVILNEDEAEEFLDHQLATMNFKKVPKKDLRAALAQGPFKGAPPTPLSLCVQAYYQKLRSTGTLDFNSILVFGAMLVDELSKQKKLLGDHLFVDEVQDSGDHDFNIYKKSMFLTKTMVGDPDQAIYSFRGGRLHHLIELSTLQPLAKVISMEHNFRSDKKICEAAQKLIRHNKLRIEKATISASEADGEVRLLHAFAGGEIESRSIANHIAELTGCLPEKMKEVAVLCRTNYLVEEFSLALQSAGLTVVKKTTPILPHDWPKCRLLISLLCNPDNDYLAAKWLGLYHDASQVQAIATLALTSVTSINRSNLHLEVPDLGQLASLLRARGVSEESISKVQFVQEGLPSNSTIRDLSLAVAQNWNLADDSKVDGVTVCTMHAAKGREWDTVFLPAFEEAVIPGTRKNVDIEEERRVAYVAATRARHLLVISHSVKRAPQYGPNTPNPSEVSRFAVEMLNN